MWLLGASGAGRGCKVPGDDFGARRPNLMVSALNTGPGKQGGFLSFVTYLGSISFSFYFASLRLEGGNASQHPRIRDNEILSWPATRMQSHLVQLSSTPLSKFPHNCGQK